MRVALEVSSVSGGDRLKILLSGMVAGDPRQGGASWAVLQYVAGLRSLGHEVVLVEPVDGGEARPGGRGRSLLRSSCRCSTGRAALLAQGGRETLGLPYAALERFASEADLLINVSGMLRDERLLEPIPARLFLDLDPGFNQVWQETGEEMGHRPAHPLRHGRRRGRPRGLPDPDLRPHWIHTLPPVALEHWPVGRRRPAATPSPASATGAATDRSSTGGSPTASARTRCASCSSCRRRSARKLPARPRHPPRRARRFGGAAGQRLGPARPARGGRHPERYAEFVRGSKAELSVAKSGYVASRSGWFSDRSACYLASGRPVVAQETGFSDFLPTGEGLLAFATTAEAADAVATVEADPGADTAKRRGRLPRSISTRARCCPGCSRSWAGLGPNLSCRDEGDPLQPPLPGRHRAGLRSPGAAERARKQRSLYRPLRGLAGGHDRGRAGPALALGHRGAGGGDDARRPGPGDEAIMPSFAYPTMATAVVRQGATPGLRRHRPPRPSTSIRAEVEAARGATDQGDRRRSLWRRRLRDGRAARRSPQSGSTVIEDAAHCLLATYGDRPLGHARRPRDSQLPPHQERDQRRGRRAPGQRSGAAASGPRSSGRKGPTASASSGARSTATPGSTSAPPSRPARSLPPSCGAAGDGAGDHRARRLAIWSRYHEAFAELEADGPGAAPGTCRPAAPTTATSTT